MAAAAANSSLSMLLLGATGFIGGAVLDALLHSPLSQGCSLTLVSRTDDKAEALRSRYASVGGGRKITVVRASHDEQARMKQLASEADVVLNCADADDKPLAEAMVDGLTERAKSQAASGGRSKPLLLHTSGTSVFTLPEDDEGRSPPKHTWDDAKPDDFWKLPESAPHHEVDLAVLKGQERGIDVLIVLPPTIHGVGPGLNPHSIQVPMLITAALLRKLKPQAGVLGTGANHWHFVHIKDLARAYLRILQAALGVDEQGKPNSSAKPLSYGREGIFYVSQGEYALKDLAAAIGKTLHRMAPEVVDTVEVRPFEEADYPNVGGEARGLLFGGNAVVRPTKITQLGWKATESDMWASVEEECGRLLQQKREGKLKGPADK